MRFWLDAQLADIFGVTVRPSADDRRRHLRPDRRLSRVAGVPAARPVREVRHRGARHHRRPVRRPGRPPVPARRPDLERPGDADLPTRPVPRAGVADLERRRGPAGRGVRDRHRRLRRLSRRDGEPPPVLQGPRRGVGRPQPLRRPHRHARGGGGRAHLRTWPASGEVTEAEATALRRHLVLEMARMAGGRPGDDPASRESGATTTCPRSSGTAPTSAPTFRCRWSSPTPCGRC